MKKRVFSLLCVLAVVLVFALTAQTAPLSWSVGAEESTSTKKSSQEEPYVEPSTSATSATQPPMPTTSSTTKKEEEDSSTKPTESSTNPTDPTSKPTEKPTENPVTSEKEHPSGSEPASEKDSTKAPSSSTTKKDGKTTTTKRSAYTTTKRYVPHMTVPQVDNTTVEGTTLNPLDAYFERISGDSNTFAAITEEQTQPQEPEEEHKQLSTIAIVAICLGGIALVTVLLTAGFAIRNKHADDAETAAADYENDAYGANEYEAPEAKQQQTTRPKVDESDSFTVVSLDDKDYKD